MSAFEKKLDEAIASMELILAEVRDVKRAGTVEENKGAMEAMDRLFDSAVEKLRLAISMSGKCDDSELVQQVLQRTVDILGRKQNQVRQKLLPEEKGPAQPAIQCATSNPELEAIILATVLPPDTSVSWESIKGHEEVKEALRQAVVLPKKYPGLFTGTREPWRSILLYGPPGTGKTQLARAVAAECGCMFFSVSSSDLISKWMGESEKLVKVLFEMARGRKPSIVFVDEVDALCSVRGGGESDVVRRVKTEFLVQMNNIPKDVFVLAVTNLPWDIDAAILRRFEQRLYVPLPNEAAREQIVTSFLDESPNTLGTEDVDSLVAATDGFSGSDIKQLLKKANMIPVKEYLRCPPSQDAPLTPPLLEYRHVAEMLKTAKATVPPTMLQQYSTY